MRFLAFSPQAALALLAGVAAAILLTYLLRPQRRRVVVASNLIWRQVTAGGRAKRERWRWLLSLLLALAIGLAIATALTRPEVAAIAGTAKRIVLVMDNAPSMAARTRDGATRWRHALERARSVIANAGPASKFMVLYTTGPASIPAFTDAEQALAQLARLEPATFGTARMPWVPPDTDSASSQDLVLVTDGVAPLEVPAAAHVQSVFEAADNVAITAFEARPQLRDPLRYEALAQVLNASDTNRRVTIELWAADGFAATRELEIASGQRIEEVFDVSAFAGGALRARVRTDGDAFEADDDAYAVVGVHGARKVLLVTAGNPPLEEALKLMPAIALSIVKPESYPAGARQASVGAFDAYVFDGFAPPEPAPGGALMFGAPNVPWIGGPATEVGKVTVTQWDRSHPLAQDVAWRELRVRRAALARLASGTERAGVVLARGSAEGALVSAGEAQHRWIRVGFALRDSNLPYQAGFPVFLSHAIEWLDPRSAAIARGLGTVVLPWGHAMVTDGAGRSLAVATLTTESRFEAHSAGVYTARDGEVERKVVVNAHDPQRSEINRSRFVGATPSTTRSTRPPPSPVEPWMLLLAAAAVLLVVEWLTYSRRLTV